MITDEQVKLAANIYIGMPVDHNLPSGNMTDMRKALDFYEQSKWVKFDLNDASTYPANEKKEDFSIYCIVERTNGDYFIGYTKNGIWHSNDDSCPCFDRNIYRWQPLPTFKE
jgi:hypothetical protein